MPRRLTAGRLVAIAFLTAATLGACGGSPSTGTAAPASAQPGPSGPGGSSPEASPGGPGAPSTAVDPGPPLVWLPDWADDSVPEAVARRSPLPFCGVEQAPVAQPAEFIDRSVRLCFWNAHLAGTPAEFASVQTTMEGKPFAVVYRLAADGTVETLTDFTQDPFGGGTWVRATCERVVEGEGQALLGVDGCEDGGPLE